MNPAPLLVSFSSEKEFLTAAQHLQDDVDLLTSHKKLLSKQFPPCTDARSLAVLFGYSLRFVVAMAHRPTKHYRRFFIKSGKKKRLINSPRVALKAIQSWFGHHLARTVNLPNCVHGFVPGRSAITAANCHLGADWVASIDIQDFFPSTKINRVIEVLGHLEYPDRAVSILSKLLTLNGELPQGSPASPVIANLAFERTDAKLLEFTSSVKGAYTRYADDLVISGKGNAPAKIIPTLEALVAAEGWMVSTKKSLLQQAPQPRIVHGLLVHGAALRLPKRYRNRVRMMLHARSQNAELEPTLAQQYDGHIAYSSAVYGGNLAKL